MTQAQRKRRDLVARRKWIKLYPMECLNGSIRYQLTSEGRGTWYDLLNFAAICTNHGTISDRDGRPYPHDFIANRLNISVELLETTITSCITEGRLTEDETGIHITNWKLYQSEYDRQKAYRHKPKLPLSPLFPLSDFDAYAEELRPQFPEINFTDEMVKFHLYWSEGGRKLKRPKLALLNWMNKAKEMKKDGKNRKDNKPGIPGNRPAGAFDNLAEGN